MKGAIQVARAVYQQESMFSHTAIVQSSCKLLTGLVLVLPASKLKKVRNNAFKNKFIEAIPAPSPWFV